MKKYPLLISILIVITSLLLPIPANCQSIDKECISYGPNGTQYDVEPLGIFIFELIQNEDVSFKYFSYTVPNKELNCIEENQYIPVILPQPYCCEGLKAVDLTDEEKEVDGISKKCVRR